MFNKDGFKELGNNIYVYNNFLSNEECDLILEDILKLKEYQWSMPSYITEQNVSVSINSLESVKNIRKKMIALMLEGGYCHFEGRATKLLKGAVRGTHADIYQTQNVTDKSNEYIEGQDFELADILTHGNIVYFNDFVGGELYYPNQNNLVYKPKKGDFLVHGAEEECRHGVKKVLSDVRYSAVGNFFKHGKVAKGFNFPYTPPDKAVG
jgi:hypothetical protein